MFIVGETLFRSPEFSRAHCGQICDEIAVGTTMIASIARILHLVDEGP